MAKKNLFTSDSQPSNRGRKKGSTNRTTQEMRDFIQKVVNKNFDRLETDLDAMPPVHRWTVIQKITQYFMPVLSKNENSNENSGEISIVVKYNDSTDNKKEIL